MSDLYIYEKMLKIMRERRKLIEETITFGSVPDYSAFQDLRAKLGELAFLEQELKNLHNKVIEDE
jgi:hypothetical protein|tara:strand:- start:6447 stop:6641 length:195 start_codon:yes stop_codon:yes gene_type:complete